jgi:hypothetical protein
MKSACCISSFCSFSSSYSIRPLPLSQPQNVHAAKKKTGPADIFRNKNAATANGSKGKPNNAANLKKNNSSMSKLSLKAALAQHKSKKGGVHIGW